MKKRKTLRVPRKLKKEYKKIWEHGKGRKVFIIKSTIAKTASWQETLISVWGCEVRFKIKKA